jgi:PAS domain-containing protein
VVDGAPRSWAAGDVEVLAEAAAAELALRERARQLAESRRRLEDAIESMPDAFSLYDAAERLVLCNRRYGEFFPRSAGLMVPGARHVDVVRAGVERGDFGPVDDEDAFIAAATARHRAGGAWELRLADGRWLHVATRRTSDGGIVAVRRDITERKLVEQAVEHLAMHDTLTGLPNRRMFRRELDRARARAARSGGRLVVALIDLDGSSR